MEIKINENSITLDGVEYIKKEQTPKDGEVWYVEYDKNNRWVFIKRENGNMLGCYTAYCFSVNFIDVHPRPQSYVFHESDIKLLRPATPEEIELLHSKLAENGKKWNAEKKCLEDLPKPLKEGDLAIFWDDDKTEAFIAKYVRVERNGQYSNCGWFKHAIPFESIEQYKEFITN